MQDLQTPYLQPALSATSKLITYSSWFNPSNNHIYIFNCLMFHIQNCNYRDNPFQLCVSNSKHFIKASCTERRGLAAPQRGANSLLSNICHLPWSTKDSCRTGSTFILNFHLPSLGHQRTSNLRKHGSGSKNRFVIMTVLKKKFFFSYGQTYHILHMLYQDRYTL